MGDREALSLHQRFRSPVKGSPGFLAIFNVSLGTRCRGLIIKVKHQPFPRLPLGGARSWEQESSSSRTSSLVMPATFLFPRKPGRLDLDDPDSQPLPCLTEGLTFSTLSRKMMPTLGDDDDDDDDFTDNGLSNEISSYTPYRKCQGCTHCLITHPVVGNFRVLRDESDLLAHTNPTAASVFPTVQRVQTLRSFRCWPCSR